MPESQTLLFTPTYLMHRHSYTPAGLIHRHYLTCLMHRHSYTPAGLIHRHCLTCLMHRHSYTLIYTLTCLSHKREALPSPSLPLTEGENSFHRQRRAPCDAHFPLFSFFFLKTPDHWNTVVNTLAVTRQTRASPLSA